jgi:hypothetical protein
MTEDPSVRRDIISVAIDIARTVAQIDL